MISPDCSPKGSEFLVPGHSCELSYLCGSWSILKEVFFVGHEEYLDPHGCGGSQTLRCTLVPQLVGKLHLPDVYGAGLSIVLVLLLGRSCSYEKEKDHPHTYISNGPQLTEKSQSLSEKWSQDRPLGVLATDITADGWSDAILCSWPSSQFAPSVPCTDSTS